jgi:membrane protease YdiL (CAAX protease family)
MFFLVLIIPVVVGLILTLIFGFIANSYGLVNFTESPILFSIYLGLVTLTFLLVFFIYNKITKTNFKAASLFKLKFGWKNLALCIIIAVVTLFGFNNLINYFFYLLEKIGYAPDTTLPLPLNNGWWLVINLFVLAVIPAICEEVIYRGVILNGFRKFGKINAVLLSALFFALAHGSAVQFIYQFILGIVLGFILIKTGSIVASMIVHFLNNAIVIVYNYGMPVQSVQTSYSSSEIVLYFVLAIASVGLLILLINWLKEKKSVQISYNEEYNKVYDNRENKFSSTQSRAIFWIACTIAVVLWAIGTFVR